MEVREINNGIRNREGDQCEQTSEHDYNKIHEDDDDDDVNLIPRIFADSLIFTKL